MGSSINIALASIAREFGVDAVSLGWVSTAYTLAAAAFLVPFGRLADIVGRRKVFIAGVLTYAMSTILSALSTSGTMLIACRALEGAGSALIFGTGTAMLTSVYPPQERGRVLGINVAAVYVGLSVGPTAGGFLTQHLGWRSIFWVTMPLALMLAILAAWRIRGDWAEARGEAFDLPGSVMYALALVALVYGLSSLPRASGAGLLGLGALGLIAFVLWEARTKSPVLEISLFRENTVFALSNLAAWANYGATTAVGLLLSLYLQYIKGLSPQDAGAIMVAQPIVMALFSPLAGHLSDRFEPRIVASAGMALTVVGLVMLATLGDGTPLAFVIACLIVLGGPQALRPGLGDGRHHASDRADVQHGHDHARLCPAHRPGPDLTRELWAVPGERAHDLHRLGDPVCLRRPGLARPGKATPGGAHGSSQGRLILPGRSKAQEPRP
jgi:EmrB/QacA subfamily drug resistance transporter